MTASDDQVDVRNDRDAHRYEAHVGGELVGYAAYQLDGDRVVFTHTEVDDRLEGHGIGSALAAHALDDVRASHRQAVPLCPFIAAFIRRHQDYVDVVDPQHRAEVTGR